MLLTKQQARVYRYLETYIRTNGRPPSYQEIQSYFNFCSLNSVAKHLKQLERKGYLESPWGNQKRAFKLLPLRTTAATVRFLDGWLLALPLRRWNCPRQWRYPKVY